MYEWEISLRGSNMVVMCSGKVFDDYNSAKEDLVKAIRGDFETMVRVEGLEYNYTIFDHKATEK